MKLKSLFKLLLINIMFFSLNGVFALEVGTFTELQNLINNNTSGTIKLEKDYVNGGSESFIIISKDLTLDLNGHVIDAHSYNRVFYIEDADVIITDSKKDVIHKFDVATSDNDLLNTLLATLNETGGTYEVSGGCITGGFSRFDNGAGIYLKNANLTFESGNIIGNKTPNDKLGAGVYISNNSMMILDGGNVIHNWAPHNSETQGGGVYIASGDLIINSGTIGYNRALYGGGIALGDANGSIVMNGGDITGNYSGHYGGGIAIGAGNVEIKGGVIKENCTVGGWLGHGGGIGINAGTLTITGGTITKNKGVRGGAIGAWLGGVVNIYGGVITENISTADPDPYDGTSGNFGAGIFFDSKYVYYKQATELVLTIGKDAVITNNYNAVSQKEENVYFTNNAGQKIHVGTGEYAPSDKMNVGITMASLGTFTHDISEDYSFGFTYDEKGYAPVKEGNILKFAVDNENPTGKISFKNNFFTSFLNTITFGLLFNEKYEVTITAEDNTGIKSIQYYIANKKLSMDEVKEITSWKDYSKILIEEDNEYVIYAKITDIAQNVTYISSDGFILDTTPALINGIENNKEYYATLKFNVTDKYLDLVKINDKEALDYTLEGDIDKTYEVVAIDKAGNVTKYTVKMKTIEELGDKIQDITVENVKKEDKPVIEEVKEIIVNDTKDATEEEKEQLNVIEDKCDELLDVINKLEENPNTFDNIISIVVIGITSLSVALGYSLYLNKHQCK